MTSMNITASINQISSSTDEWTWSLRTIFVLIICSLITILTILGNGLVLISVKYRFHARSYSDYFIISLCLADFFVGLFVMPFMTLHSLHLRWPFHYRFCYIWMSIDFTCSTASFLTLASMALDRYYALTAPYFHLRNRSYSSVIICIISSWAIPFAIWPSSIFLAHHFNVNEPTCVHPAHPFIIVILCTFFYYIPLLFMLICYSRIIVNIKNIEVMIKSTWDSCQFNPVDYDYQLETNDKNIHIRPSISPSNTTISSFILRYFQRNCFKSSEESPYKTNSSLIRQGRITNHGIISTKLSPPCNHRLNRQTTTATFTGKKRCINEINEDNRIKPDLLINQDEEQQQQQQQLIRARLSTRTSSLPAARCISYYYYQNQLSSQTRLCEEKNRSRLNSITNDRSRSQSHSSSQGIGNAGLPISDISDHSSSLENNLDEEQRRLNRRQHPSRVSTSYHSSRYSQRAIAQFMHERNKARLRRNQKASRMLGILLAVFLICWLPFTISYPTMIFYPSKFPPQLESIIFWLGYVNSLLNPFLYVYSSRNFRQAIIETICCYTRLRTRQHLRYQWSLRNQNNS